MIVWKSGSLNFLEPSRSVQACNGIALPFFLLRKATVSFAMAVRPSVRLSACNNSAPTGRIFIKFDISVEIIQVSLKLDKYKGHFARRPIYIFYHISLNFI